MSTPGSNPIGWQLRPYENHLAAPHRALFHRWVTVGQRNDYAYVSLDPPLHPSESGISESLERVVLGPRHEGVRLDQFGATWPVHVYLLTAAPEAAEGGTIPADGLKIRGWALLESLL